MNKLRGMLYATMSRFRHGHFRRGRLLLLSTILAVIGLSLWQLQDSEVYWVTFWPLWFGASAGVVLAFNIFPWHFRLYQAAGFMALTCFMSRITSVIARWWILGTIEGWRSIVGVCVYVLLCVYLYIGWLENVGPWHREQAKLRDLENEPIGD